MNRLTILSLLALVVFASPAFAGVEKTTAFVCPVLNATVGLHNPNAVPIAGGDYTVIPTGSPLLVSVPLHATNSDGSGSPGGSHSAPGDNGYSPLWNLG